MIHTKSLRPLVDHTVPTGVVLCVPMKKSPNQLLDYNQFHTKVSTRKLIIIRNQLCFTTVVK